MEVPFETHGDAELLNEIGLGLGSAAPTCLRAGGGIKWKIGHLALNGEEMYANVHRLDEGVA